jgi:hypothetical protein
LDVIMKIGGEENYGNTKKKKALKVCL